MATTPEQIQDRRKTLTALFRAEDERHRSEIQLLGQMSARIQEECPHADQVITDCGNGKSYFCRDCKHTWYDTYC